MITTPRIHPVTAQDVPALAETLAAAFQDDPVFRWWIGDDARRRQILPAFFGVITEAHRTAGTVHTTDELDSAAVWAPPGAEDDEALVGELATAAGEYAGSMFEILERMAEQHPAEPHWYLFFVGTRPERQSRGLGSAVMRPVLEACDATGMPAYLEATSERNAGLYRRHGFEVVGEIELPDGPSLWPMWREAR
jgi:ribosomal protein S18 acetylase RimI-like enzyme